MIQCAECEHYRTDAEGVARFSCNPFHNIKEPECIAKWQLIKQEAFLQRTSRLEQRLELIAGRVETLVHAYQAMQRIYERLAPMQEKMFRHMEREIDEIDESESWKLGYEDDEPDDDMPPREY
jgi:hypothetical protein